jgi:hypothetical protein
MAAINPILIIVNDRVADTFQRPPNDRTRCGLAAIFCQENGELAAESNPSLTTWWLAVGNSSGRIARHWDPGYRHAASFGTD